jgi:flagellar hook-associated protein 1 FlgK
MGGLFGALRIGVKSLSNTETALSVVSENIANVNTPGYSRKRVIFESGPSLIRPFGTLGTGAEIGRIESLRDHFVERRLIAELRHFGFLEGQEFGMRQVEALLSTSGEADVADQLSRLFNGFLELAANPSSLPLRQAVLSEAEKFTNTVQVMAARLDSIDVENRQQIIDSVEDVNFTLRRIADIDGELSALLASGKDGGALQDERQELLKSLSEEIGILAYETESGQQMITTTDGRLLMAGSSVFELRTEKTASGVVVIYEFEDISSEISSGRLGGYLEFQNTQLPYYKDNLNQFVGELASSVNAIHQSGTGLDGSTALDFFTFVAGNEAKSLAVNISDPNSLAAAGPGGEPGDGTVAQQIADLRDQTFPALGGDTLHGFYSQIVLQSGLETRDLEGSLVTQKMIVNELKNQRDSVSGVSLDEEAAQLLQFQRAYQASARVIQVVDGLLEEVINLVR